MIQIEGRHEVHAPRERVFAILVDPQVLQRCIPGCESLQQTGEHQYAASLKASVGAIKGSFNGQVQLADLAPPAQYRMSVSGKGAPGFLKGTGTLELEEHDGLTVVRYRGEVQVGGTLASVGQRMIQGAAKMMASQFFTAVEAEAKAAEAAAPPPEHGFFRTALRWFSGLLRRWFRGRRQAG